jgi:hypothetical protein
MQDLGYKALTTFVKVATYHAMGRYTEDEKLSHSEYLRRLIEADLIKKGYLRVPAVPEAPLKPKPKRRQSPLP